MKRTALPYVLQSHVSRNVVRQKVVYFLSTIFADYALGKLKIFALCAYLRISGLGKAFSVSYAYGEGDGRCTCEKYHRP